MLHVDDDEVEARQRKDRGDVRVVKLGECPQQRSSRVRGRCRQQFPKVPHGAHVGSLSGLAVGIGYSPALTTQPSCWEKSRRGGQKMSMRWFRTWPTDWLVCRAGGGMMAIDGLATRSWSSSRQSDRLGVHGLRTWWR